MNLPLNPPEYGLRMIDQIVFTQLHDVFQRRDLFRYAPGARVCTHVETKLTERFGRDALLVSNGTAGLQASLAALGIEAGDEVLVSTFTFHATANAVIRLGAKPIPVDLDLHNGMDLTDLEQKKTPGVAAAIVVHFPGRCFTLQPLLEKLGNIPLIEDACQAMFAQDSDGRFAGTSGQLGVFSFQQNKLLTSGEGGAVLARTKTLSEAARQFTDHGLLRYPDGRPLFPEVLTPGDNLRMSGLNASLLLGQLDRLDELLDDLDKSHFEIRQRLISAGLPVVDSLPASIGQDIIIDCGQRASVLTTSLQKSGVVLSTIWRQPFHRLYGDRFREYHCPTAEYVSSCFRRIPIPAKMTSKLRDRLVDVVINAWFSHEG